jgi:mRNA interferase MazF
VKRGDLVAVALSGDYGKPRPALVIQSDAFHQLESVIVAPLTSTISDAPLLRILIEPTEANGLRKPSAVMVDKLVAVARARIGPRIGSVDTATLDSVSRVIRGLLELQQ